MRLFDPQSPHDGALCKVWKYSNGCFSLYVLSITDSTNILNPAHGGFEKHAVQVLRGASALFPPYSLKWDCHEEKTCSTLSISIELFTSISSCNLRIDDGTIGIITGIWLVVGSSFAPNKKRQLAALRIVSRALVPLGLEASSEWTGFILSNSNIEIASSWKIISRMLADDSLRYSWSCGKRKKSLWSMKALAGCFSPLDRCCVLLLRVTRAFFWSLQATVARIFWTIWWIIRPIFIFLALQLRFS